MIFRNDRKTGEFKTSTQMTSRGHAVFIMLFGESKTIEAAPRLGRIFYTQFRQNQNRSVESKI